MRVLLTGATGFIGIEVARRVPGDDAFVEGTAQLARVAADAGVEHIVYGSSMFVYDGSTAVDDDTDAKPVIAYG